MVLRLSDLLRPVLSSDLPEGYVDGPVTPVTEEGLTTVQRLWSTKKELSLASQATGTQVPLP